MTTKMEIDLPILSVGSIHKVREQITHDTYIFKFKLPDPEKELGLHLGGHLMFVADIPTKEHPKGEIVERKYTPTNRINHKGDIEFPIKIYRKNVHPNFPDGGIMTQYLESLQIGDFVKMRGPRGRCEYQGKGIWDIAPHPKFGGDHKTIKKTKIGMIAGGTGITPIFQIIQAALENRDILDMTFLFGNRSEDDILMRDRL